MFTRRSTFRNAVLASTVLGGFGLAAQPAMAQICPGSIQSWTGGNTQHDQNPGQLHYGGDGEWNATNTNWEKQDTTHGPWEGQVASFRGPLRVQDEAIIRSQVSVAGTQSVSCMIIDRPYGFLGTGALAIGGATLRIHVAGDEVLGSTTTPTADFSVGITGAGRLIKSGQGTLILRGVSSYTGGTELAEGRVDVRATGALGTGPVTVLTAGALNFTGAAVDAEGLAVSSEGVIDISGYTGTTGLAIGSLSGGGAVRMGEETLILGDLDRDDTITGVIAGGESSQLVKSGAGTLTLSGVNTYTGFTTVREGTLNIEGSIAGNVGVYGGALGGSGTIGGTASITDTGALQGKSGSTLRFASSLTLSDASAVNVTLGAPGETALFDVAGDLTLDGRLNAAAGTGFRDGVYRLFDYRGGLTNNGLVVTTVPTGHNPGDWSLSTTTAGQVNLIVPTADSGPGEQYWDGSNTSPGNVANGRGGNGVWNAANTNWTNQAGSINAPWAGGVAVFSGSTTLDAQVTVDAVGISARGLRFIGGRAYRFDGGALNLEAGSRVDVGAGTIAFFGGVLNGGGDLSIIGGGDARLNGNVTVAGRFVLDNRQTMQGNTTPPRPTLTVNGGPLIVGDSAGSQTQLDAYGDLTSQGGVIGAQQGSSGTVRLLTSSWNAGANDIVVGDSGAGTLTVSGSPSFGGMGRISADRIVLGQQAAGRGTLDLAFAGTGAGNITASEIVGGAGGGTVIFNHNPGVTAGDYPYDFSTRMTGNLAVDFNNGVTRLAGTHDYTGATTVTNGILSLNGGLIANSAVTVRGGVLTGNGSINGAVTVGGKLDTGGFPYLEGSTGTTLRMGSLTLLSDAVVQTTLGAPSTAALFNVLGDLVLDGTLNVSNGGGFGDGVYRIFDYGGTLTDNGLEIGTLPGASTGAIQTSIARQVNLVVGGGPVDPGGPGEVQFWNGSQTSANGTVSGGAGAWNGTSTNWTDANGTRADAWGGRFAVFQGTAGTVTVDAAGVNATGMQFAVDGYRVEGGAVTLAAPATLRVGDGSAAGAGYTATIASAIGGTGGIDKTDLGTLILTGANSYTGGTRVSGGTLIGNAGSIRGDANIAANASLVFDQSDAGTFAGVLSGAGGFAKRGAGALTLAGDSAAFTGASTLEAGSLFVNGSLGGALSVRSGATLGGTGRVGDLTVASGGTVAPGGSIGTLTVGGNFVQAAGSTYRVEINPAGQSDRINVLGTATIQGGTVYADKATGVYAPGTRYTILNAVGGVTGTYTSLEQNAPFVNLKLAYDASNVFLDVERNAIAFCSVASTRNQCATGNGVESLGSGALYDAVAGQPSEEAARAAFDALSGEIYASARGAMLDDTRLPRQAVLARLANAGEGNGAWGQVFGNWGSNDGDGNAFAMDRDTKGLMAGIDMTAGENWRFGFAAGYTRTDIDIDRIGSNGDIDGVHLMGYAGGSYGPVRIRAGIGYAKLDLGANRSIAFNGFTDAARGKVDGSAFQGFAELGYALPVAGGEIEPYAGFTAVRLRTDAFAETGAGAARLSGQRMSETSSFSTLGLRGNIETGGVRFEGAIAWRHAFGDITPEARLAFAGGDRFTLAGTPLNRDEAMIRAGASIRLAPNLTLGARYEGAIGNRSTDHSAQGVLSLAF